MSPIDASRLDVRVTEGERWRRTLNVTVPADVVEAEKGAITRQLASRLKVRGFRAGKVPASVIAKRYGHAVEKEALDQLIQDAFKEAVTAHELRPISEGEVEDVQFTKDEPLSFTVSFDVRPEFSVGRVGGFKAQRPQATVPDDALDRVLERLQEQHATWSSADEGTPGDGDFVEVHLTRMSEDEPDDEGQKYEFVLGHGQALPDIENAIKTLDVGQSGEFDITFPDDFPDESRRGEQQRLTIEVLARRVQALPDLDDAFAKSVGEFEDMAALQEKITADLDKDADRQAEDALRNQLLQLVLEANAFDVPQSMVTPTSIRSSVTQRA